MDRRLDDRAGVGHDRLAHRLVRAGRRRFDETIDLFDAIGEELMKRKLDCILVDEAQFLTRDHVLQLCEIADELGIPVLCYGLRTDFQAQSLPGLGGAARARGHAHRAEGGLRMRAQGDDEPARRCRGPCGRGRRRRPRSAATTATSRFAAAISSSGCARAAPGSLRWASPGAKAAPWGHAD